VKKTDIYIDLDGQEIFLVHLDAEERKLVARIQRRARTYPDWNAFDNWSTVAIPAFYEARGLAREVVPRTLPCVRQGLVPTSVTVREAKDYQ
jgi:hypothetical protein